MVNDNNNWQPFLAKDSKYYYQFISLLPTVDGGQDIPSLGNQVGVPPQMVSNVLLWTGAAAKNGVKK